MEEIEARRSDVSLEGVVEEVSGGARVKGPIGEMTREAEEVSGVREALRRAGWPTLLPWCGEEVRAGGEGLVEDEGVVEGGVNEAGVVEEEVGVVNREEVVEGEGCAGRLDAAILLFRTSEAEVVDGVREEWRGAG